ncbi:FadR/GntR family transcriptional regulator [Shewanella gelidii]|uniref:GntR family transcriptional regulator n=1 Tax=Shewanella gelidii TaxID=1642821 RepID=A0A917JLQ9_9GAMM|nr:FadR/GntR family transcriptional regulator [Shewanella gelidii]MCL1096946.1 FadR family transcriptional regulator [Shewanella gelidii]GGI71434.1 GntR family transcriptional regulator [Shewanella gelidii]
MEPFKPIKQVKASDRVLQQLKSAIFNGQFSAGDKLPSERELIENFQVSRTVVREAIKVLEASGLIEIKQGAMGGAFVKLMNFEHLSSATKDLFFMNQMTFREICEARLEIEPLVARLAAENCSAEDAERLRFACQNESATLEYPETVILRSKVHYILAEMCNNRYLTAIVKSMIELVGKITKQFEPDTDQIHPAGLHDVIVEAVIAGDAETAEREMREHLKYFLDTLQQIEQEYRQKG